MWPPLRFKVVLGPSIDGGGIVQSYKAPVSQPPPIRRLVFEGAIIIRRHIVPFWKACRCLEMGGLLSRDGFGSPRDQQRAERRTPQDGRSMARRRSVVRW